MAAELIPLAQQNLDRALRGIAPMTSRRPETVLYRMAVNMTEQSRP